MKWSAAWIASSDVKGKPNVCFRARRLSRFSSPPGTFPLHICAESLYRLYVNGRFVGRGPARGTQTVSFYDTIDIAPYLQQGDNWIAAEVHCHNLATSQANPIEPALLIQSDDHQIATDQTWQVQTANEWRGDVPIFTYQVGYMEWKDLRGEPEGWQTGADSTAWNVATIVSRNHEIGGKRLLARDVPDLKERAIAPVEISVLGCTPPIDFMDDGEVALRVTTEPHEPIVATIRQESPRLVIPPQGGKGVVILINFREEVNGRFEIDLDAPSGTVLDVGYEEEARNSRLALTAFGYRFADRYILRGGRQTAGNLFATRGFRVVQIVLRNFNRPVTIESVRAVQRRYPYARQARFECSDALINDIWQASVETIAACSTDVIVDCPWRENTLWLNDLLVSNITSLQAFGDPRIGARCFRLAISQPRSNGLLPGAVPAGLMPGMELEPSRDIAVLLPTNLFLANMIEEHLRYTGDVELAREILPVLFRIHQVFDGWEDAQGVVQPHKPFWNFIDWSYPHPPEEGRENACTLNWFRVWSMQGMADLLDHLSLQPDVAQRFRARAREIAKAIDARFWNENRQCYVENTAAPEGLASQVSHAVALLAGGVPSKHRSAAIAALNRDDLLAPELYMQHLVLRALVRFGDPSLAMHRIRRFWGSIVDGGSPTIGECGVHQPHSKASFFGAASLCHGFSTTPIDFCQSVVLGVVPLAQGFTRCSIAPKVLDLHSASGTVPTPRGDLKVRWKRNGQEVLLEVDVPPGVMVDLPDGARLTSGSHVVKLDLSRDIVPVAFR